MWIFFCLKHDKQYKYTKRVFCVYTGIRMWALNGYNLVDGYPKYIHRLGLPKTVKKVDAAVHIKDTGKTLLFTEEDYWRCVRETAQRCCF